MLLPRRKLFGSRARSTRCRPHTNRLQVELLEDRLVPTTFTILNANDSGANSLRDAILQANADLSPGTDIIQFNIPASGVQTITLAAASGPLPVITDSVLIDGASQPGFAGSPLIVLDGSELSSGDGLVINAANSTIKSLAIDHFTNGTGIVIGVFGSTGVTGNQIVGCYLGVAADGTTAAANDIGVRIDNGASGNTIGGSSVAARNLLSGNTEFGVAIGGSAATNVVVGNFIGLDATGLAAVPNGRIGIILAGGAHHNTIGGTIDAARNVISANIDNEIAIDGEGGAGADQNRVQGNFIGTDITGKSAPTGANNKPDAGAVSIGAGAKNNTIGGGVAGARNLISANGSTGVVISDAGTTGNLVAGNIIGLDVTASVSLGNDGAGVTIRNGASNNTIGGLTTLAANVISGNLGDGVHIADATSTLNIVEGNFIGTNGLGTVAIGNVGDGVFIDGAAGNTVGGADSPARNVLSGNSRNGVTIFDATAAGNTVANNYIGTDITGEIALSINGGDGVRVDGAPNNLIADNLISGNTQNGLSIVNAGASANRVERNVIGANAAKTKGLGNAAAGIVLEAGAHNNLIGGTNPGTKNMISGNGTDGILLKDPATTANIIDFNVIGVFVSPLDQLPEDISGMLSLGNKGDGIHIEFSPNNQIGDTILDAGLSIGNIIAFNAGAGIAVGDASSGFATGNRIQQNYIFGNGDLGINSTPGTLGHFPTLTSAFYYNIVIPHTFHSPTLKLTGTLTAVANTSYRIEFFSNQTPDASGSGQGQTFLGFTTLMTDALGTGVFETTVEGFYYKPESISATATGPDNTTSRFARNISVIEPSVFSFNQISVTVPNLTDDLTIVVARKPGNDGTVQVEYATRAVAAIAGTDFLPASGTLTFGPGETQKSITVTVLNNPAATNFRAFYVDLLNPSGDSLVGFPSVLQVFIAGNDSPKPTPNFQYVAALYSALLGRTADASGAQFWTDLVDQGASRSTVALGFEYSPEGRIALVQNLYKTYLHRTADPLGLQSSVAFLSIGGTAEHLKAVIFSSPEYFQNRGGGTNGGFLAALYMDVLGRTVDPVGTLLFGQALAQGASRFTIAFIIIKSLEAEQIYLQSLYLVYLNRPADPVGARFFLDAGNAGASDEAVLAAILGSDEFLSRAQ